MISFEEACSLALNFYEEKLHIHGLAEARESNSVYIFSGGAPGTLHIGSRTITVDKENGCISALKFPSRENSMLYMNAKVIDLPDSLKG